MILTVTVLLIWFGLALLTVCALNVWKLLVMRPSETWVEHRLLASQQLLQQQQQVSPAARPTHRGAARLGATIDVVG